MRLNNEYFKQFHVTNPAYGALRRSGRHIRKNASIFFSGRLLDIGCGSKAKQLLIGEFVKTYVGLDQLDCRHDQSNIDVFGSAYHLAFKNDSFDDIICTAVLEHLEEPESALREAHRVLRPGGFAIYTIPFFWHLHEEPRDFYRYSKYGITYLFEKCGFEIVELMPLSGFWMTFGTELNYFLTSFASYKPLRPLLLPIIVVNNMLLPVLDRLDRRFHPATEKWTWLYMVTARKKTIT